MEVIAPDSKETLTAKVNRISYTIHRNRATRGLFWFVAVPTLLATIYYSLIASDIYVSESKFSVNISGQSSGGGMGGSLGMLLPSLGSSGGTHETLTVKEYIESATIVDKLEKQIGLRKMFSSDKADFLARISPSEKKEQFVEDYNSMVDVVVDEISGITTLRARAFTPQDSQKLAAAILDSTEEFVNRMSDRMKEDSINFAKRELEKSESLVVDANKKLAEFRNTNQNFDPSVTTKNIIGITSKLEEELALTKSELANLRNYMQGNSPKIEMLESKVATLQQQINEQTGRIASEGGSKLADLTENYESLMMNKEFAMKRYEISLSSYETAQADARKKSKYLLRIVEATQPEIATEPKRLRQIFTVFLTCLIGYTLVSLIITAIKDHIRP